MSEDKENLSSEFFHLTNHEDEADNIMPALEEEVSLISDQKIRSFVRFILMRAETFWYAPVSVDLDEFPPDEYEEGGLVLHTLRSVRAFLLMSQTLECSNVERDCAIAALLLRNCTKFIVSGTGKNASLHYDQFHLYTIDGFIDWCFADAQQKGEDIGEILGVTIDDLNLLLSLIHSSNGFLSPIRETFPVTFLQKTVHFADLMAASAYNILYMGTEEEEEEDDD